VISNGFAISIGEAFLSQALAAAFCDSRKKNKAEKYSYKKQL